MRIQAETKAAVRRLTPGTISAESMAIGRIKGEPLFYALDGMLRYAKAHAKRCGWTLSEDCFLGPYWLETVKGLRGLLNGNGAVAMEIGRSQDSKDNGVCEEIFWAAMSAAGFEEEDL